MHQSKRDLLGIMLICYTYENTVLINATNFVLLSSQFWNTSEEMTLEIKTPEYATTNDANVIFATQLKPINI